MEARVRGRESTKKEKKEGKKKKESAYAILGGLI